MSVCHSAIGLLMLLALAGGCARMAAERGTEREEARGAVYAHLVLVPEALPDGQPAAAELGEFKKELVRLAGGYTQLAPAEGGWLDPRGKLETERNIPLLICAPRDLSETMRKEVARRFKQEMPFVLVWRGRWAQ